MTFLSKTLVALLAGTTAIGLADKVKGFDEVQLTTRTTKQVNQSSYGNWMAW